METSTARPASSSRAAAAAAAAAAPVTADPSHSLAHAGGTTAGSLDATSAHGVADPSRCDETSPSDACISEFTRFSVEPEASVSLLLAVALTAATCVRGSGGGGGGGDADGALYPAVLPSLQLLDCRRVPFGSVSVDDDDVDAPVNVVVSRRVKGLPRRRDSSTGRDRRRGGW